MAAQADRGILGILLVSIHTALVTSKAAIQSLQASEYRAAQAMNQVLHLVASAQELGMESVGCQDILRACHEAQAAQDPARLH